MMTSHKTAHRQRRHDPETQQKLEAQSRRIAQLEAHLDELSTTSDELQAQFLKLRRDTLLAAAEGLAH